MEPGALLIAPIAMWLAGYGAFMMIGKDKQYIAFTKKVMRWTGRELWSQVKKLWSRNRKLFIGFAIGFILALYILTQGRTM